MQTQISRTMARAMPVLLLMFVGGASGHAHRSALDVGLLRTSRPRLVRHRVGLQAIARQSETPAAGTPQQVDDDSDDERMSGMGRLAHLAATGRLQQLIAKARAEQAGGLGLVGALEAPLAEGDTGDDDEGEGPAGGQAELTIAVDKTGQHVVVGMNDTRGFGLNPLSISGFAYSDDGGMTFIDGGQLPITTGTTTIGSTVYPQVFGDPEVKYVGGSNFIYFSIMVNKITNIIGGVPRDGTAQTMCVHRSTDNGHTWTGPYEIPPATNPHGLVFVSSNAVDAADKEFVDLDPDTGRVMMSWSNFTLASIAPGRVEISSTFSDNITTATPPTWSARTIVAATAAEGQASIPRFAGGGSSNVYIAWRRFVPLTFNQNVGFTRSTDNGRTWSLPINLTSNFFTMDQVLGNDRVNTSPSMAVDNSGGTYNGNIYVVYSNNNKHDGADVAFQRSIDGGLSFSPAVMINSRPGSDRAQWFPWVTVDKNTGRVYVFYYDQGIAANGDLTETTYEFSDDGGATFSKPMPLTDRPFHAGYGNDTGQPNLGDYNQAVAQGGELFVVWAGNPNGVGFADGQPSSASFTVPDVYFKRAPAPKASLRLGTVTFTDSNGNGFIDAGEQVSLKLSLENYVINPAAGAAAIGGTLTSPTPGVTVTQTSSAYPPLGAGASAANDVDFVLQLSPAFVPGTHIELKLQVSSSEGSTVLLHTLSTGTPGETILLSEDFDSVAPGTLPAGWTPVHGTPGGANVVPWTTSNTFNPGNNGAFHKNANDGGSGGNTRFERLFSPLFSVPPNAEYVTVDFDTKYDTEDESLMNIQAYDGFTLRITDMTAGRALRSNLVEAFAEEFTTGALQHFPKHLPRNSNTAYLEDMSVWAGDSGGIQHVHLKLPGMAGSTAQLRFEYTQDAVFTCANVRPGHTCGVLVDNVVVKSVVSVQADVSISKAGVPEPVVSGSDLTYTIVASNAAGDPFKNTATGVTMSDTLPLGTTYVSSSAPAGWTCTTPVVGFGGTLSCSKPSMAPGESAIFTLVVNVNCATPNGTIVTNTATVNSASTPDPNLVNNSSSWPTTVSNPPPVISGVSATPSQLWPPNHKLVDVTVNYTVSDNCGAVTTSLAVTSNEPVDGTGDGDTAPDWIVVDEHHVQLRSERAGAGAGRIYSITITATDNVGASSSQVVTVLVPRDNLK